MKYLIFLWVAGAVLFVGCSGESGSNGSGTHSASKSKSVSIIDSDSVKVMHPVSSYIKNTKQEVGKDAVTPPQMPNKSGTMPSEDLSLPQ